MYKYDYVRNKIVSIIKDSKYQRIVQFVPLVLSHRYDHNIDPTMTKLQPCTIDEGAKL